jgi:precorrin-3B synthase
VPSTSPARPRGSRRPGRDRCPGVFRPWEADDGGLVRLRLIGGHISGPSLLALRDIARTYGDGRIHLTSRANLQLRRMPLEAGQLPDAAVDAIERAGLLPSRTHELVRNVMVSPLTGIAGGRTDLGPVAARLDQLLCADERLAGLPGRFLFVLDDGRGDLTSRTCDVGLVALSDSEAQLRIGASGWGEVVPLDRAPEALVGLAGRFLDVRGTAKNAPWHVDELTEPLTDLREPDPRAVVSSPPLPYGSVDGGMHVPVLDDAVDRLLATQLARHDELVVTPWHGVLVPGTQGQVQQEDAS